MTIEELEKLMIEKGLVIRAIPYETTSIYSVNPRYIRPNAEIFYDEKRKCNMIKETKKNSKGGKFIITKKPDQGAQIIYWKEYGKPLLFFDTIEDAINSIK